MKKIFASFCLITLHSPATNAQEIEPYVSAFGGVSLSAEQEFVLDTPFSINNPRPADPRSWSGETVSHEARAMFGGAIGAHVSFNPVLRFRLEGEGARRRTISDEGATADFSGLNGSGSFETTFDGEVSVISGMANLLWEPELSDRVQPYIGGGVGVARVKSNLSDAFNDGPSGTACLAAISPLVIAPKRFTGEDTVLSWQLIGGASTPITEKLSVFSEARYFRTGKVNHDGLFGYNDFAICSPPQFTTSAAVSSEYDEITVTAGVRISF